LTNSLDFAKKRGNPNIFMELFTGESY